MTLGTGTGVLHRMTQRQQPDAPDVPLTASRAVRLALARGAQSSVGMKVTVGSVGEQALPLDPLLTEFDDDMLLLALTRDGAICGLLACDAGLVAATIEVMTTGRIGTSPPETRRVTRTECTLVQTLLRAILDEMEETTARTALDGWTRNVGLGQRFDTCRAASFALTDRTYRLMRLSLDCGAPERQGALLLALPLQPSAMPQAQVVIHDAPIVDWHTQFRAAVMAAPARLDAVLHRLKVPLSTLTSLEVGQCLPLPGCTVGMVRLVDSAGRTVARGRLGQIAGQIAVRVQAEADAIPMTEMDHTSDAGIDRRSGVRTRAGDKAAPQFTMGEVDEADWSAAPQPLAL
ncbi:FliM/FliN family flagellar motor switch protein [Loktanella sp. DJP18]|uniref:FliM/FliN family flagellar motor switch protein n=1 Tax=Loktanella sp. DJP18 TaxID=3409788 RepID=UPI003BB752CE